MKQNLIKGEPIEIGNLKHIQLVKENEKYDLEAEVSQLFCEVSLDYDFYVNIEKCCSCGKHSQIHVISEDEQETLELGGEFRPDEDEPFNLAEKHLKEPRMFKCKNCKQPYMFRYPNLYPLSEKFLEELDKRNSIDNKNQIKLFE